MIGFLNQCGAPEILAVVIVPCVIGYVLYRVIKAAVRDAADRNKRPDA